MFQRFSLTFRFRCAKSCSSNSANSNEHCTVMIRISFLVTWFGILIKRAAVSDVKDFLHESGYVSSIRMYLLARKREKTHAFSPELEMFYAYYCTPCNLRYILRAISQYTAKVYWLYTFWSFPSIIMCISVCMYTMCMGKKEFAVVIKP